MLLSIFIGCAAPVEAPTELSELTGWLFENHIADEDTLAAGLVNLTELLDDPPEDGYLLDPLTEERVADIAHPDRDPADTLSLAVTGESPFAPEEHVVLMKLSDLTAVSPSAERFDRSFLSDPGCFPASCDALLTDNDIYRSNLLMSMGLSISKDYRRITLESGTAFIARGWMPESAHGEDGNNHLWQSYELDIWLPTEEGTQRMLVMWSEGEYAGINDDLMFSIARMGIQDSFAAQDAWLSGE